MAPLRTRLLGSLQVATNSNSVVLHHAMGWNPSKELLALFFGALHTIQNNKTQKCINLCAFNWCLYVINMHSLKWRTRCTLEIIPLFLILVRESFYFYLSLWNLFSFFFMFGVFVHYSV
jgi:hypothetical protein